MKSSVALAPESRGSYPAVDFADAPPDEVAPEPGGEVDEEIADPPLEDLAALDLDDDAAAGWLVDRLLSFDERIARVRAQSEQHIAMLERARERFRAAAEPELRAYYERNRPAKARSLKLAAGTIGYRRAPGGLRVLHKTAMIEWAKRAAPDLVELKVTAHVTADAVRARFESTGEIPDGCDVVEERDTFYVRGPK